MRHNFDGIENLVSRLFRLDHMGKEMASLVVPIPLSHTSGAVPWVFAMTRMGRSLYLTGFSTGKLRHAAAASTRIGSPSSASSCISAPSAGYGHRPAIGNDSAALPNKPDRVIQQVCRPLTLLVIVNQGKNAGALSVTIFDVEKCTV
jgi:hypothetical protein